MSSHSNLQRVARVDQFASETAGLYQITTSRKKEPESSRNWDASQEQINLSTIIPTIDSQEEFQSDKSLSLKDLKMGQIQKQVKTKLNILGDHSPQQNILPTSFSTKEDRPSTQRAPKKKSEQLRKYLSPSFHETEKQQQTCSESNKENA